MNGITWFNFWYQTHPNLYNSIDKISALNSGYFRWRLYNFQQFLEQIWVGPYCTLNNFFYFLISVLLVYVTAWILDLRAKNNNSWSLFAEVCVSPYTRALLHATTLFYILGLLSTSLNTRGYTMPVGFDSWIYPLKEIVPINLGLGTDGLSIAFGLLTWYIFTLCEKWIRNKNITQQIEFMLAFIISQISIYICFFTTDLMLFFIGFELASIPMFWMILRHGSRERKQRAAIYFILYTLLSSVFLFVPILSLMVKFGTTEIYNLNILIKDNCTDFEQLIYAYCLFIGFGVKVPIVPLHYWLTEAHVEAPTVGSVLLAALVLKLGGYGLIKFLMFLFPKVCASFHLHVQNLALISAIYAAWVALRQDDIKRIIAYSSISHMNFSLVALFSMTLPGLLAGIGLMVGHGFVAAGLFSMVGTLYDRIRTRLTIGLNGISRAMPRLATVATLLVLANFGFPLTVNFVGEQIALMSLAEQSVKLMIFLSSSIILTVAFSLWFLNRTQFGTLQVQYKSNTSDIRMIDLTEAEFRTMKYLCLIIILLGIYPELYLDLIRDDSTFILSWILGN